eukprot:9670-Pelagococcus_subviridis.AAC.3
MGTSPILSYRTRLVAVLVEGEHALLVHELHDRVLVRERELDLDPEVLLHVVEELVRLRVQPTRVQGEDAEGSARERRVLDQRDVLRAAERDGERVAENLERAVQDRDRRGVLELRVELLPVDGRRRGLRGGRGGGRDGAARGGVLLRGNLLRGGASARSSACGRVRDGDARRRERRRHRARGHGVRGRVVATIDEKETRDERVAECGRRDR